MLLCTAVFLITSHTLWRTDRQFMQPGGRWMGWRRFRWRRQQPAAQVPQHALALSAGPSQVNSQVEEVPSVLPLATSPAGAIATLQVQSTTCGVKGVSGQ